MAVNSAVLTKRLAIFADHICVEVAARRAWVRGGLSCTSSRAAAGVKRLAIVPILVTQVGGAAVAVTWGTDGITAQVVSVTVASAVVDCLVHIAIGASNDDVVVVAVLAIVHGVGSSDWATPEHTLDQSSAIRLLASTSRRRRVQGWRPLKC